MKAATPPCASTRSALRTVGLTKAPGRARVANPRGWATAAALGSFVGAVLTGCPSSTTSLPYTPYTGINFVSQTIVSGHGCGMGDDQVFNYVVVIGDPTDAGLPSLAPLADGAPGAYASLVDCFTNAVFSSVASAPDGGPTVEAWIYAYDFADFQQATQNGSPPAFASCTEPTCPLSLSDVQTIIRTYSTYSTYTTTCTATPESGDNVLASCLPLQSTQGADAAATDGSAAPEASISDAIEDDAGSGAALGD